MFRWRNYEISSIYTESKKKKKPICFVSRCTFCLEKNSQSLEIINVVEYIVRRLHFNGKDDRVEPEKNMM